MKKAMIEGKIARLAKLSDETIDFSVLVSQTFVDECAFTMGTVVRCTVKAPDESILAEFMRPNVCLVRSIEQAKDTFKTATGLAVGDHVVVYLDKGEDGIWKVVGLDQKANRGQDVSEFLNDVEKELSSRRKKA